MVDVVETFGDPLGTDRIRVGMPIIDAAAALGRVFLVLSDRDAVLFSYDPEVLALPLGGEHLSTVARLRRTSRRGQRHWVGANSGSTYSSVDIFGGTSTLHSHAGSTSNLASIALLGALVLQADPAPAQYVWRTGQYGCSAFDSADSAAHGFSFDTGIAWGVSQPMRDATYDTRQVTYDRRGCGRQPAGSTSCMVEGVDPNRSTISTTDWFFLQFNDR